MALASSAALGDPPEVLARVVAVAHLDDSALLGRFSIDAVFRGIDRIAAPVGRLKAALSRIESGGHMARRGVCAVTGLVFEKLSTGDRSAGICGCAPVENHQKTLGRMQKARSEG